MDQKKILSTLFSCAETYESNLLGKTFLFIGESDRKNTYSFFETSFEKRHFMHFTGCKLITAGTSETFFDLCVSRRLSLDAFTTVSQTVLKIEVLKPLMSLPFTAKMMGDSINGGNRLYTEKLAGQNRGCMGFVLGNQAPYYSPNTVIQADIRNVTIKPYKILAVYGKMAAENLYPNKPLNTSKELRSKQLYWPPEIASKINEPIQNISKFV